MPAGRPGGLRPWVGAAWCCGWGMVGADQLGAGDWQLHGHLVTILSTQMLPCCVLSGTEGLREKVTGRCLQRICWPLMGPNLPVWTQEAATG